MEKVITESEKMDASQQYLKNSDMNQFLWKETECQVCKYR